MQIPKTLRRVVVTGIGCGSRIEKTFLHARRYVENESTNRHADARRRSGARLHEHAEWQILNRKIAIRRIGRSHPAAKLGIVCSVGHSLDEMKLPGFVHRFGERARAER